MNSNYNYANSGDSTLGSENNNEYDYYAIEPNVSSHEYTKGVKFDKTSEMLILLHTLD